MSALSDAISKHAPEQKQPTLDAWFASLDDEDREVVERIIHDPTWSGERILRMLRDLGVRVAKGTFNEWRRERGFPG